MEGKVVVLLRTSSVARAPIYHHLRYRLGIILVVVHPWAPAEDFHDVFHHWLQEDTCNVDVLRPALDAFLSERELRADAIVSFDEYAVYQAAVLAQGKGLTCVPLPPAEIQRTNMKAAFRDFCRAEGVASPAAALLPRLAGEAAAAAGEAAAATKSAKDTDCQEAVERHVRACMAAAGLCLPLVLKPSPGAGSLLARRCDSVQEAARHARTMWAAFDNARDMMKHFAAVASSEARAQVNVQPADSEGCLQGSTRDANAEDAHCGQVEVLMEEFIGGHEVDIDCIVQHGQVKFFAISDNFEPLPPFFAEAGGLCPSALDMPVQQALRDLLYQYVNMYSTDTATCRHHGSDGGRCRENSAAEKACAAGEPALTRVPAARVVMNGVLHFEAKYDPARQRAFIVEVNCRPGSAETNTMVRTAYRGLQLGEGLVRCALGFPVEEQLARHYPECFPRGLRSALLPVDASDDSEKAESVAGCDGCDGAEAAVDSGADQSGCCCRSSEGSRSHGNAFCRGGHAALRDGDGESDEELCPCGTATHTKCGGCPCSAFCECACCTCGSETGGVTGKAAASGCDCQRSALSSMQAIVQPPVTCSSSTGDGAFPSWREAAATDMGAKGTTSFVAYSEALGGPTRGAFPPTTYAASVNIYPARDGILTHVAVPDAKGLSSRGASSVSVGAAAGADQGHEAGVRVVAVDASPSQGALGNGVHRHDGAGECHLVDFSVAARPGDHVGPPPRPFCLLAWLVVDGGDSAAVARQRIDAVARRFEQRIVPV